MGLCAVATSVILGIHTLSYHTDVGGHYNNVNTGAYVSYNNFTVGTYWNSDRRQSTYIGKEYELTESCRFDATVGVISGYKKSLTPAVILGTKIDLSDISDNSFMHLVIAPTTRSDNGGHLYGVVIHAMVEKRF